MSHSHEHPARESSGNLRAAFFINLSFTLIEIAGGIWTNSIAILTDALHDFGDSASLGLAWYFDRLSHRGPTPRLTYGYQRYRLLGGLITGLTLILGLVFILWHAVERLKSPEPVNAPGMLVLAAIGLAANGAAAWRMRRGSSLTERLVSWHLLEDTLGWAAVLVGAAVMAIWNLPVIDPLLSIGISLLVLWNAGKSLTKVMRIFLQSGPPSFDVDEFERQVRRLPGVARTHHLHVWSLDGERHVLTLHLVMGAETTPGDILRVKRGIRALLDAEEFKHVTIDVELAGEACVAEQEIIPGKPPIP